MLDDVKLPTTEKNREKGYEMLGRVEIVWRVVKKTSIQRGLLSKDLKGMKLLHVDWAEQHPRQMDWSSR